MASRILTVDEIGKQEKEINKKSGIINGNDYNFIANPNAITQISNKKTKISPNKANTAEYLSKSAGTGIIGGFTNIYSALSTDIANNFQKGAKKSTGKAAKNLGKKILTNSITPISIPYYTYKGYKELDKNIKQNKDKNLLQNVVKTGMNLAKSDSILDAATQLASAALPEKTSNKVSKKLLKSNEIVSKPVNSLQEDLNNMNVGTGTKIIGGAVQSIGNMLPAIAVSAATENPALATTLSLSTMGLSAKGSTTNEQLKQGKSLNDAVKRGNVDATIEIGTEMLTGGLKIFGKGTLDDAAEAGIKKLAKTKLQKELLQRGYQIGGEVLEETISDVLNSAIDYSEDSNVKYGLKDWGKTAAATVLSTVGLNLLTGGYAGGLNMVNQNIGVNEYAKQKGLSKQQVNNEINKEIENRLPFVKKDNVTSYSEDKQLRNTIKNDILNEMNSGNYVPTQDRGKQFTYKATDNEKVNTMLQSIADKGYTNTQQTHNLAHTAEKLIRDLDVNVRILNNEDILNNALQEYANQENMSFEDAKDLYNTGILSDEEIGYRDNINGYKVGNDIVLNADSKELQNFVLGHEITHFLEKESDLYKAVQDSLFELSEMKKLLQEDRANIEKRYRSVINEEITKKAKEMGRDLTQPEIDEIKNQIINTELTADYVGQFFTDNNFIEKLGQKPGMLQKLLEFLEKLYYNITGKEEKTKILDAKNKINKLYTEYSKNVKINDKLLDENGKPKTYNRYQPDYANMSDNFDYNQSKTSHKTGFGITFTDDSKYIEGKDAKDVLKSTITTKNGLLRDTNNVIPQDQVNKLNNVFNEYIPEVKMFKDNITEGELIDEINRAAEIIANAQDNNAGRKAYVEFYKAINKDGYIRKESDGSELLSVVSKNSIDKLNKKIQYSISPDSGKLQENGKDVTLETSNTGTTGTLMAIHNLSEDKLKGILELGGFPVPSIAITNPNLVSHEGYGKISVLFDKSTIDPAVKENEVYDRDVWSPTFPTVESEIIEENLEKVADEIGIRDYYLEDYAERHPNIEDLIYTVLREDDVVNKYLDENNIDYNKDLSRKDIRQIAIDNGIEKYLKNKLENIYGEKGIYNGKEYLTPSGKRKAFWQTHDKYNLKNIVKNLKSQDTVSSKTSIFGSTFGNVQANMSNRFKSINDIKTNESKIMSSEKANAEVQKIVDEFNQEAVELSKLYGDNFDLFWDMDSINYQMQELSKLENVTSQGFYDIANKYNPTLANADNKLVDRIVNTMNKLKNIPTDYFEAKPQRAVGLDEVQQIVIPNTTDVEFKQQLQDAGLQYTEYDPNIEGDRQRVINQFDDLKFSIGEESSERYDRLYKPKNKSTDRLNEILPINIPEEPERAELPTKNDKINAIDKAVENKKYTKSSKAINEAVRTGDNYIDFTKKEKQQFKEALKKYENMSKEDLVDNAAEVESEIRNVVNQFATREANYTNENLSQLQKLIKGRTFKLPEFLESDIADFDLFKKNNRKNFKISRTDGEGLDVFYEDMISEYPSFKGNDPDFMSETDILKKLANIMNEDTTIYDSYVLSNEEVNKYANKIFNKLIQNTFTDNDIDELRAKLNKNINQNITRHEAIERYRTLARENLGDLSQYTDKKRGFLYEMNTMKRNLRDIVSKDNKAQANKLYNEYFKPVTEHNATIEKQINKYNERFAKYDINKAESTYIQMLGEFKYNPETTLTEEEVNEFYDKNMRKIDKDKCEKVIEDARKTYDDLFEQMNEVLVNNGYKPIEYRKGYFPHFIEDKPTSIIGKMAEKLGWKVQKGTLPTDIAGITDMFTPGKAWTSFSQRRTGDATDYNFLKGYDNYIRGAMDLIYHTEDIQKLRALENEIRYQSSDEALQEKINAIYNDSSLDMEQKNEQIAELMNNKDIKLGNLVTQLRSYTNNLANKKNAGDRGMEEFFGRDSYSIMNNINSRVSANMVGANISSALTNFIPITQAWSQISTKNLMRGMYEAVKTTIKDDGFADNSTYLTNRTKQADRLFKTNLDKINQTLGIPFEAIDNFTSNVIVRGKYYDNLQKGMTEAEAMDNANEFAKDVMAGRSKGDQPTVFNKKNPVYKLFTAFQLEVNNQYGYMFKDLPLDLKDEALGKLALAYLKMFLGAYIYNYFAEKITGRKSAFSPIDMAVDDIKTVTDKDLDIADKVKAVGKDVSQELPFVSGIVGGGRLPISGAIPYASSSAYGGSLIDDVSDLFDEKKKSKAIKSITKEFSKPIYYIAMPFAGGQIKKSVEGLQMYDKDLPVAGSYTDTGRLRFEADTSPLGKLQSAVFGQYASKNAREYFDKGQSPLTEKQIKEALDADLPISEYRQIDKGIKDAKAKAKKEERNQSEAMYDYIYDLPLSDDQKNSLINSRTKGEDTITDKNGYIKYEDKNGKTYWYDKNTDTVYNNKYKEIKSVDVSELTKYSTKKDISDYGNYGSLKEFNYANKNPKEYLTLTQITDYDTYNEYKDEIAAIKQNYSEATTEIRKKKVFDYINSLPLNKYQKTMLYKTAGGYSINNYKKDIHNYINSLNLSKQEKQTIYDELISKEK